MTLRAAVAGTSGLVATRAIDFAYWQKVAYDVFCVDVEKRFLVAGRWIEFVALRTVLQLWLQQVRTVGKSCE